MSKCLLKKVRVRNNHHIHNRRYHSHYDILSIILILFFLLSACTKTPLPKEPMITTTSEIYGQVTPGKEAKFSLETMPSIDGSTVTIPISELIAATFLDLPLQDARMMVKHNKTHPAYVSLVDQTVDLIFATYASQEELDYAKSQHVELEFIPIVKDAFVFFVNKKNTVSSVTSKQLRQIYSGEYTMWNQIEPTYNIPILAYQRPINSGSQSGIIELVMNGTPLMNAPTENRMQDMSIIIDAVSAYDNSEQAIGYSYYYYVNSMYYQELIKLLAVDGIAVENATIESDAYPYITYYYAVLNKSKANNVPANSIIAYLLSEEGQEALEDLGYVKLGK